MGSLEIFSISFDFKEMLTLTFADNWDFNKIYIFHGIQKMNWNSGRQIVPREKNYLIIRTQKKLT